MEPLSPDLRPKLSARARLQTDRLTGKPIVLYPEGVLMLNKTGEAIISLCDGQSTFEEILARLSGRFNTQPEKIASEVSNYLNELRARNLLELLRP